MAKGKVIVNLRRDWYAPDGSLYEARHNPHEFPADWADKPPKDAPEKQKYAVLPSGATIVDGGRTVEVYRNTADGTGVLTPEVVEEGVKSVGNTVDETSKGPTDHNKTHQSTSVASAVAAAKQSGAEIGGKPRESNPAGGMSGGKK